MPKRAPNPRLAKIHRSYTVDEVARLYGVHRNTVREWIKRGLPTCDSRRPVLIVGGMLADFLTQRRAAWKRPCKPGEVYCVRCRAPKAPALGMAEYRPLTATGGNLVGICPTCEGLIFRRVSLAKLAQVRGELDITMPEGLQHIVESGAPSLNSDFSAGPPNHA